MKRVKAINVSKFFNTMAIKVSVDDFKELIRQRDITVVIHMINKIGFIGGKVVIHRYLVPLQNAIIYCSSEGKEIELPENLLVIEVDGFPCTLP